ncbi:MAG: histone deacetylase [Proteobacteria bacterium]|nr:histone deacetylase [Pseudomonadota bacterium]MBU1714900.1 histone deacetylase [Pseudomonadota bacterium]
MARTAIFKDDLFLEHNSGRGHVESPDRLAAIYDRLTRADFNENVFYPAFEPASLELLALNHSASHIARIEATAGQHFVQLDPDTQASAQSYDAASLAVGAAVSGTRMIMAGEADNGFVLVRPPGHHAEADRTSGFCLFNNIAVAAHYAIKELAVKRVLIVDWDLHHGNGTQNSFYDTDQVFYFSSHQFPYFPGTGSILEVGEGKGEGFTINVPLPGGHDDMAYAAVFNEILVPLARQYKPELILVSAGFDIYQRDPLGTMAVSINGFAYLAKVLNNLALELCAGRLLLVLEGGYNLEGLGDGVMACVAEMSGHGSVLDPEIGEKLAQAKGQNGSMEQAIINQVKKIAKNYWAI